jgi:hypothetical protein
MAGRLTVSFDNLAFTIRDAVDPSMMNLLPSAKDTLPSSDGVSTDDGT